MANPLAKLKGANFKELALEHGEKVVLGLIAVIGLLIIFSARYSGETRTPLELETKVTEAEKRLAQSTMSEEELQALSPAVDLELISKQKLAGINTVNQFMFSTDSVWPLYKQEEKIREPEWLPVEELRAEFLYVILNVTPPMSNLASTMPGSDPLDPLAQNPLDPTAPKQPLSEFDQDLAPKTGATGPQGYNITGAPGYTTPGLSNPMGVTATTPGPSSRPGSRSKQGSTPEEMSLMSPEMSAMSSLPTMEGRGERCVSVTGIFPLKSQLDKIAKALNMQPTQFYQQYSGMGANNLVEILDFELQRQAAVAGPEPWKEENWEKVDINYAMKVLNEVADFDPDEVDPGVTDVVITMPLPSLVIGRWGDRATHPRVSNFKLSEKELEAKNKMDRMIIEEYAKQNQGLQIEPEKKGFATSQLNMREMRSSVMMGNPEYSTSFTQRMAQEMDPSQQNNTYYMDNLQQRVNASGHLLLFRYFDFDVRPGMAYRYRVQLKLRNPNLGLPREQVAEFSVAEGEDRETPWSTPTAPVIVPQDTHYFLTKVDYPLRETDSPAARLNLFQWYSKTGTMVHEELATQPGAFLGGKVKTEVLDPAQQKFEKQEIEIRSQDVLVDIDLVPHVTQEAHPDLKLPNSGRIRGQLGIPEQVLVVNQYGELEPVNPTTNIDQLAGVQARIDAQEKYFGYLKELNKPQGDQLEQYQYTNEGPTNNRRSRTLNPNRLRSRGNTTPMSP